MKSPTKFPRIVLFFILCAFILISMACQLFEGDYDDSAYPPPEEWGEPPQATPTAGQPIQPPPLDVDSPIPLPPSGSLYHAAFPGGLQDWGEEDDIFLDDLRSYENHAGKTAAWVYFSHNWFRDRSFPLETVEWIRQAGSLPYIRLMLRSDAEQDHAEDIFTLDRIIAGDFDADLNAWGTSARDFGTPLIVEYGTEVNGEWFSWNGIWNGGGEVDEYGDPEVADGPERFRDAYRHIISTIEAAGAENITWVFHIDNSDVPDEEWNQFENYYPGDEWIDWIGVSIYGALEPTEDECETFSEAMDWSYARMTGLAPGKPVVVLEFGTADNNRSCDQADWARQALNEMISGRWPALIGFSWWNENWQNDDNPEDDTHMRIQDNQELSQVFQELVGENPNVLGLIEFP